MLPNRNGCKKLMDRIPDARRKTFVQLTFHVFQAGHVLCSKQDIFCIPSRTFLVFQSGHFLCSKQDISCVPGRTFRVFHAGQSLCSKRKWLKNREDGSDFDDFLRKSIVSTRSSFSKIFASSKKLSRRRKISNERTNERTIKFSSDARVTK